MTNVKDFKIGKVNVGTKHQPFVIAEMSGNHNQSLERGIKIIEEAARCGVHAVKLQTYTADTLTINHSGGLFDIKDENSPWNGRNLYELYQEAHTPWEWHEELFAHARKCGLEIFSTPFDHTAVDFLEDLGVDAYKIASFENNHLPLLKYVASTRKPVIMSTGLASISDLEEAVTTLRENGCSDLVLLKCTSSYPASPKNTNLLTIPHLAKLFQCHVGLSDHTGGIGTAIGAVSLGARVIEKHFTLDRNDGGVDAAFSLEPDELKSLVIESERVFEALGEVQYGVQEVEQKSRNFKRSIYVTTDIKKGEPFTEENISIIRPGDGLKPKYYELLLGRVALKSLKRGTPLNWEMI